VIGKSLTLVGTDENTTIIDATGLGVGVYVNGIDNANLTGVTVTHLTVQNAKYEGILAANVARIDITHNIVTGNNKALTFGGGPPSCPGIPAFETGEDFDCGEGIHLSGVSNGLILDNIVQGNAGGILISDDTGPAFNNTIMGNNVSNNPSDCGITLASHAPAAFTKGKEPFGVYHNDVIRNVASQNGLKGEGAGVGIFASGPKGKAHGNRVMYNTLTGNDLPGVTIHGHTPDQNLDNTVIIGNTISGNGPDIDEAATPGTAGIAFTSVAPIHGTVIEENTISGQDIGVVWNTPGAVAVSRNNLMLRGVGVYNLGAGSVEAENNYWGWLRAAGVGRKWLRDGAGRRGDDPDLGDEAVRSDRQAVGRGLGTISRASQERASFQSRRTVCSEVLSTWAVSWTLRPPKNRSSTTFSFRGSNLARASRASSSAIICSSRMGTPSIDSFSSRRTAPPPRRSAVRARAALTRMRRIICAQTAKKWARSCHCAIRASTSRRYASCTSAVGCSVWPTRSRCS